tara:strand:- start:369 stop:533 length:165 start_codon:yes stop_codon:yes gene_type:complete
MKQKFFLHIENGVITFEDLEEGMKLKELLNKKGIKARLRMRTPYNKEEKGRLPL